MISLSFPAISVVIEFFVYEQTIERPRQAVAVPPTDAPASRNYSRSQSILQQNQHSSIVKNVSSNLDSSHGRRISIDDLVDNCLPDLSNQSRNNGKSINGTVLQENKSFMPHARRGNISIVPDSTSNSSLSESKSIIERKADPLNRVPIKVPISDNPRLEVGLENLGNTCFMNSTLQCLLHIKPLVNYFLKASNIDRDLNTLSPKKGALATSFHQLVVEVYNKKNSSAVSPIHFQRTV